jgi:soluble lytic murein transglycosylase-like protein
MAQQEPAMRSILLVLALSGLVPSAAQAKHRRAAPPPRAFEAEIAKYAQVHGVPETLIHKVIIRESRYNPNLIGGHRHYGLMQISYATARSMGYSGSPAGLLEPDTNLAYAVPYLANAYRAAGRSEAGALRLYSSGYYGTAKRRGLLPELRTAASPSLAPPESAPAAPPPPDNPFLRLFNLSPPPAAAAAANEPSQP